MDDERCIIREAADADLERLAALYEEFLEGVFHADGDITRNPRLDLPRTLSRLMRRRDAVVLAAETDAELIGFARVDLRRGTDRPLTLRQRIRECFTHRLSAMPMLFADHGYLAHLFVREDFRRRGVGRALVQASAEWVKTRGGKSLDLNVLATNDAATAFYRELGMSELLVHYRMRL